MDAWLTILLVFARVGALLFVAPLVSAEGVPRHVPVLLGLAVTALIAPHVRVAELDTVLHACFAVGGEVLLGLLVGAGLHAVFSALSLAGEVSAQQSGFGMMMLFNPVVKTSEGPFGVLAGLLAGVTFLAGGGPQRLLVALADGFDTVPPGSLGLSTDAAGSLVGVVGGSVLLGVQLAGPVVILLLLLNGFVGVLGRLAPKMNVFFSLGQSLSGVFGTALFAAVLPWMILAEGDALTDALSWAAHRLAGG